MKRCSLFPVPWKRIWITLLSVILMGVFLSVLNLLGFGTDPFSFMNLSIAAALDISLGNWQLLLNMAMFLPVILWGRKQIGIGTVMNMVLVGYTMDLCTWLWEWIRLPVLLQLPAAKILSMLVCLAGFVLSAATYMSTGMGTAPYDALPAMLHNRIRRLPYWVVRLAWDVTTVVIGLVVGGKVGLVTVLMVPTLGKTVEWVKKRFFPEHDKKTAV